jgi:TetR/AcrR family transcriptional repressor of nem operon
MANELQARPKLTPRGERTRARIVDAAAQLVWKQGVVGTTLDDVRSSAEVSGSQLTHYFASKDELVQAVIDHQSDVIVTNQEAADLGSADGLRAWRDMVIAQATMNEAKGGCPLGSLGSQLAESDDQARDLVAAGFDRWAAALTDGLMALRETGRLSTDIAPEDLGITLLAVLQGGLLLAQVQRSARPLEIAVDSILKLATR